jgi:signal transduction histidine kinase
MGLRLRILLICLLLAGLSTLVVVAGVIGPKLGQYPAVDQQLAETSQQAVHLASLTVANELEHAERRLAWLAGEVDLGKPERALPLLAGPGDRPPVLALDAHLQVVAGGHGDFSGLAVARAALATDRPQRSGLVAWPGDGHPTVALARRFRQGVLVEPLDLAKLDHMLNRGTGTVEVFDAAGQRLIPAAPAPPTAREEVRRALAGRQETSTRADHTVVAYGPVEGPGWAVVASTPSAKLLLPLERDIRQAVLAGALAMLIGAALAVLLSAFLVAPIRRLEAGAAALARGEWEAGGQLPTRREDELGRLARSFEAMAAQLRDRFRGIEHEVAQRTTDLAEANASLQRAVTELEELDELKRAVLDAISHELRTPLNFIMGYGSTLADGMLGPLTPDQARAVQAILGGSDRLLAMVNDLIEIARLEAGQVPMLPTAIELGELIGLTLMQLEPAWRERDQVVSLDIPAGLPPAHADPERVGQILRQLLGNAIKFTEPGGRITVAVRREGDRLVTAIEDTGVGIPAAAMPHIWEAFRQGDGSLTRRHGGTGVGLSIVRRLLDAMGERITVQSTEGVGSCFRFTLPVAAADGSRAGEGAAPQGLRQHVE